MADSRCAGCGGCWMADCFDLELADMSLLCYLNYLGGGLNAKLLYVFTNDPDVTWNPEVGCYGSTPIEACIELLLLIKSYCYCCMFF